MQVVSAPRVKREKAECWVGVGDLDELATS